MSSIDKGIEKIVNRMGRNVRVSHSGDYIVGRINGEVVFRVHDRYGYVSATEEQIVRDGIRRYDEEQRRRAQRAAEERRRREEALRLARLQAEKEERERLERLRVQARQQAFDTLKLKKQELRNVIAKHQANNDLIQKELNSINNYVVNSKKYSWLDISEVEKEVANFNKYANESILRTANHYKQVNASLTSFESKITDNLATEKYNQLAKEFRKYKIDEVEASVSAFECRQMLNKVNSINQVSKTINQTIGNLEKLEEIPGTVGNIARETLNSIRMTKVKNANDLELILSKVERSLVEIKNQSQALEIKKDINEILSLEAEINSCKEVRSLVAEGTYTAKNYRNEIVEKAKEVKEQFTELSQKEFTTCDQKRIIAVKGRLEDILLGSQSSSEVLEEVLKLEAEYQSYQESDRIHKQDFDEYNELVKELGEYEVDSKEIPAFHTSEYPQIRDFIKEKIKVLKAEKRRTDLYLNQIHSTNVMQEMGYELFSSIGDPAGNVTECLFTKRGYDGVLWQIICSAEGTLTRRIIGVNKGETQTDIEYIKEVALEMENNQEPEEFLEKFKNTTGSTFHVNSAVESHSQNAEEAIRRNGYCYLKDQALKLYQERVVEIVNNKPVAKKAREVKVQQNNIVKNSNQALLQAANRSRLMARENWKNSN